MTHSSPSPFATVAEPDWNPFTVCAVGKKPPYPRALSTPEGLGDRLRFVAFAEKQAASAFLTAPLAFPEVSAGVKKIWSLLAQEEHKHLQWLLYRMNDLTIPITDRPVSKALWDSFQRCKNEHDFAQFMANAEERGRVAGEQFYQTLLAVDPISAKIFNQIALEERQHILLAQAIIDQNFQIPPDFDPKLEVLPLQAYSELIRPESTAAQSVRPA